MKDELYYFHQTPNNLAKQLLEHIKFDDNDFVLEPFKGEGSFYNNFPDNIKKDFCEIEEGLDYKDFDKHVDWVVSNPPFKINNKNCFFDLLIYYSDKINKGLAFLGNDYCFTSLTPIRLKKLNDKGLFIDKIVCCSIKKWRGRYYFIIFKKIQNKSFSFLEDTF
jgi:hypothetical protein